MALELPLKTASWGDAVKDDWKWIIRQNRVLLLVSLVTFFAGVIYEPARWNMITTAWGTFLGGMLAWAWFELRGPSLQRSIWLRQNAQHISQFLCVIEDEAYGTVLSFVGLDNINALHRKSLDLVIAGVENLKCSLPQPHEARPHWSAESPRPEDLRNNYERIRGAAGHGFLTGLTDLQVAVHVYCDWYRAFDQWSNDAYLAQYAEVMLVSASLDLLETVSRIQAVCGLLDRVSSKS